MTRLTLATTGQHVCETDAGVTVHVEPLPAINAYLGAQGIDPIAYRPFEDCAYQVTKITYTSRAHGPA